jgi:lipoprotein-releasing system ATP-binding protein
VIKATGIKKAFGNLEVLKGIDFEVNKSEIVSIVGPSGAGKTTFLQILGTLMRPDKGIIEFEGKIISDYSGRQLAKFRNQKIGFVFQFHHLLPEFSALENVCIPALIAKDSFKNAKERAIELLEFLNLGDRLYHKPDELSGGEQQRVAVARALINNPSIVLADEPSGNLDSQNKKELHELFFNLREKYQQTFVIVTHDESLAQITDRTIYMNDGKII